MKLCEFVQQLKVPKQTVSYKIKRFKELGHGGDRPERERKRTVNRSRNRKFIKMRVQQNPRISMRKIAREIKINRETARLISRVQLGLCPYKMKEAQKLTAENKRTRL